MLGLQHSAFGTFALGRFATPSSGTGDFDLFGQVDPFGTGFGADRPAGHLHPGELAALRQRDTVGVAELGRLQVRGACTRPTSLGPDTHPERHATHQRSTFGASWTWGPLFVAATYDVKLRQLLRRV